MAERTSTLSLILPISPFSFYKPKTDRGKRKKCFLCIVSIFCSTYYLLIPTRLNLNWFSWWIRFCGGRAEMIILETLHYYIHRIWTVLFAVFVYVFLFQSFLIPADGLSHGVGNASHQAGSGRFGSGRMSLFPRYIYLNPRNIITFVSEIWIYIT